MCTYVIIVVLTLKYLDYILQQTIWILVKHPLCIPCACMHPFSGLPHDAVCICLHGNALINVKPHLPPPRHRWGFVQFVVQRTHPRGNCFLQYPSIDAPNTQGQCGDLYIYMLFEFHYNYKILTSGEYHTHNLVKINFVAN